MANKLRKPLRISDETRQEFLYRLYEKGESAENVREIIDEMWPVFGLEENWKSRQRVMNAMSTCNPLNPNMADKWKERWERLQNKSLLTPGNLPSKPWRNVLQVRLARMLRRLEMVLDDIDMKEFLTDEMATKFYNQVVSNWIQLHSQSFEIAKSETQNEQDTSPDIVRLIALLGPNDMASQSLGGDLIKELEGNENQLPSNSSAITGESNNASADLVIEAEGT